MPNLLESYTGPTGNMGTERWHSGDPNLRPAEKHSTETSFSTSQPPTLEFPPSPTMPKDPEDHQQTEADTEEVSGRISRQAKLDEFWAADTNPNHSLDE